MVYMTFNMSSDVVYNCVTCSKTVKGKQHYAICVLCSRLVHRKCYDNSLSISEWTRICQTFTCTACEASRGQHLNRNYCSDGERQVFIAEIHIEPNVSTDGPPTTIQYEFMIGASNIGW